ncbi:hypothetical protein MC885_017076 [Smutsia gigantea]|nr:hypothetical protein MC885_017076 [Smutsia gigantea]
MPRQAARPSVVGEGSGSQRASGVAATMLRSLLLHSLRLCAQTASCLVLFPRFLGTAFMLWLLDFLCIRKHLLGRGRRAQPEPEVELTRDGEEVPPDDPPVCVSDDNRLCTLASLKAVWHGQKLDFFKQAHEGGPAPNSEVVLPEGFRSQHILDYARGTRPLYQRDVDFLIIYIEEAHPSDGWVTTDSPYSIPQHRNLEDRVIAARVLQQGAPSCSLVLDTMANSSSSAYGAYFERLYVVQSGTIMYQGGRGPDGYQVSELRFWLERYDEQLHSAQPRRV